MEQSFESLIGLRVAFPPITRPCTVTARYSPAPRRQGMAVPLVTDA